MGGRIDIRDIAKAGEGKFRVVDFRGYGTTKAGRHARWLEERAKGLGGSDMATVMGLNPWRTPYDLWLEKTGRRQPDDISGKWAVVRGVALEAALRARFRALHPEWKVMDGTDRSFVSVKHPCMHASLDGIIHDPERGWGVLEIKTANANRGRTDWHDQDGNPKAPDYYMAQVTHYMAVTGFTWGVFYADIGEAEPVEVTFDRDGDDVDAVTAAAETFWAYVRDDTPPALTGTDVDRTQSQPPYPQGWEDAGDDTALLDKAAADWTRADMAEKAARKAKAKAADTLKQLVGDTREGIASPEWRAGYKTIHYKAQPARPAKEAYEVRRFTVKPIKEGN